MSKKPECPFCDREVEVVDESTIKCPKHGVMENPDAPREDDEEDDDTDEEEFE